MSQEKSLVYLIPSFLSEAAEETIPVYVLEAIKNCDVFFVENERTARRYIKALDKSFVIDDHTWFNIEDEDMVRSDFLQCLKEKKTIGIISEAGCPGVADPGQHLISLAQEHHADVKPLVGPSSILLALMASGMNGQHFHFHGYLPIDAQQRIRAIQELEVESSRKNCTQIFIETPYRNNQLLDAILNICHLNTRLCIAADITGKNESIKTRTVGEWKEHKPDLHKRPVIYCLMA